MKNILITGCNGQLGNEMQLQAAKNTQYNYFFTDVASALGCRSSDDLDVLGRVRECTDDLSQLTGCAAYDKIDHITTSDESEHRYVHVQLGTELR